MLARVRVGRSVVSARVAAATGFCAASGILWVTGCPGALHDEGQRHDMGLTIHYQLATTTGDEAHSRKLVQQLRQAALDLPFQRVGEIVEFQGHECDWKQRADDDLRP